MSLSSETSVLGTLTRNLIPKDDRFLRSMLLLLVPAIVLPSSLILVTLIMEAIRSSETSVLARATSRNTPEVGILHSHRRENFKSYIALTGWTL
jgi:hypothetical protein